MPRAAAHAPILVQLLLLSACAGKFDTRHLLDRTPRPVDSGPVATVVSTGLSSRSEWHELDPLEAAPSGPELEVDSAYSVLVLDDDRVYMARRRSVLVLDFSDPRDPVPIGQLTLAPDATRSYERQSIVAMAVVDTMLFAIERTGRLHMIDVSDPSDLSPRLQVADVLMLEREGFQVEVMEMMGQGSHLIIAARYSGEVERQGLPPRDISRSRIVRMDATSWRAPHVSTWRDAPIHIRSLAMYQGRVLMVADDILPSGGKHFRNGSRLTLLDTTQQGFSVVAETSLTFHATAVTTGGRWIYVVGFDPRAPEGASWLLSSLRADEAGFVEMASTSLPSEIASAIDLGGNGVDWRSCCERRQASQASPESALESAEFCVSGSHPLFAWSVAANGLQVVIAEVYEDVALERDRCAGEIIALRYVAVGRNGELSPRGFFLSGIVTRLGATPPRLHLLDPSSVAIFVSGDGRLAAFNLEQPANPRSLTVIQALPD